MATLTPTSGTTSCPVYLGAFSWTYDEHTSTICMFREGTCTSEWYWSTPVKVTKFNIFAHYYQFDSYITGIWGRVGGDWSLLWSGIWNPGHAFWDSKVISCNNCTGIKISQVHALQTLKSGIAEVTVDYDVIPEGSAEIMLVTAPPSFTPGVSFGMSVVLKNVGSVADTLFMRIKNVAGGVLCEQTAYVTPGTIAPALSCIINLDQITNFYWLVEAGHGDIVDDTETGVVPVAALLKCEDYLTKEECEENNCNWYSYPNPFGEPSCHSKSMLEEYVPIIAVGGTAIIVGAILLSRRRSVAYGRKKV